MRPRCVINKGIQKTITAVTKRFTPGVAYIAAIYNPQYTDTKITKSALCSEVNKKNTCMFEFTSEQTAALEAGLANIEIYDEFNATMCYREHFAIIRENSLQID